MSWTQNYKDLSTIYIKEFESRWTEGIKTARALSGYVKQEFNNVRKIVDVPCGIGRLSIPLFLEGFDVLGIDFSSQFVEYANKKIEDFKSNRVNFLIQDMYESHEVIANFEPHMIICWWTSIGYKDKKADENFFKEIRSAIKPGTIFMIETWFREYILNFPIKRFWSDLGDVIVTVDQNIDPLKETVSSVHKYYEKINGSLQLLGSFSSEIMLYSVIELKNMLEDAGWIVVNLVNSIGNTNSFDIKQDRCVFVCKSV